MNALNISLTIVFVLTVFVGASILLYFTVFKPTWEWFRLCDDLENEIRKSHNYDYQIECLYELKKKSWHRSTGERIRELALMMEIKYSVKILKK